MPRAGPSSRSLSVFRVFEDALQNFHADTQFLSQLTDIYGIKIKGMFLHRAGKRTRAHRPVLKVSWLLRGPIAPQFPDRAQTVRSPRGCGRCWHKSLP